ncbi:MAG: DUF4431 domain-containing protein [Deltaproteobacteria bacterium]|nr:DUF4431 domain-containing protein [Deltaproteobacteria bacterium]
MNLSLKSLTLIALLFVAASTAISGASSRSQPVFHYGPRVSTLSGVVDTRVYPGPLNYESIRRGDEAETIWLVKLSKPIMVADDGKYNEQEIGVNEIQLVIYDPKLERRLERRIGKTAILTGTLFHAETGHHHLPVLLEIGSLRISDE